MRRFRPIAFTFLLTALALPARPELVSAPQMLEVLGSVTNATRPVANALVIALNLKDLGAIQTWSSADGSFSLPKLPAGIYKIIAVKQGFAPAIATVVPNRPNHRVALALETEKAARKSSNDEIWQIRASLPPDILHELDRTMARPVLAANALPRMRGEMMSMTGVADQATATAFAQTSLGVESRLSENWQLGIRGNLHRIDDPTDEQRFGTPAAESSVMSMELRSSPTDSYRVASTRSFWRYRANPADRQTDVRSHDFQWEHGGARLGVRYFAQDNLFASNPFGSDVIEVNGGTTLVQGGRNDIGISMRVTQENIHNSSATPMRMADLTATGAITLVPAFTVHYGLSSRTSLDRTELAPRAGLQWKVAKNTSLVADGMVKAVEALPGEAILPTVGYTFDDGRLLPRYAVSVGLVSGGETDAHFSAIATVTAVDAPVRLLFNDGAEQFWDGFYIDSGDVRRDVRVSYRKEIGSKLAVDVSTSAGTATAADPGSGDKWYVTGDVQSIFFPTGTTILVSYRELRQPQPEGLNYHSERVNVRMAQSLHLPVDLKVLFGVEVARSENSPFLVDVTDFTANGLSRKYIGGLAVNF